MTNQEYFIDVGILTTIMFAHHSCSNEDYLHNVELREDYFLNNFHKTIVRQINHNKLNSVPIFNELIEINLIENRTMDYGLWHTIINANPFGKTLFDAYYEKIKEPKTSLYYEV